MYQIDTVGLQIESIHVNIHDDDDNQADIHDRFFFIPGQVEPDVF